MPYLSASGKVHDDKPSKQCNVQERYLEHLSDSEVKAMREAGTLVVCLHCFKD